MKSSDVTTFDIKIMEAGWAVSDRFYSIEALQQMVDKFEPALGDLCGDMEEMRLTTSLAKASHYVMRLFIKNERELWATVHILNTVCGTLIQNNLNSFSFHLAATGIVNSFGEVEHETLDYVKVYCREKQGDPHAKFRR